ncbi:MAG: metal ABC transporter substrate-binding protein [Phycisphaerales bacterium]|nr:metal ABC transporter substrate-binding protein [Phycisphaerales bacterium]
MNHIIRIILALTALGAVLGTALKMAGCQKADPSATSMSIEEVVRTTSAPIGSLTDELADGLVPVELLCPESIDPSRWRPDADTIGRFQRAKLIVTNGAQHERWVATAPLPRSRVVDSALAITPPLLTYTQKTHSHGPDGKHTHKAVLGSTWVDPLNARSQAQAVQDALARSFPEHAPEISERFSMLSQELESAHRMLEQIRDRDINFVAPIKPYGYLARRYGWAAPDLSNSPDDWLKDPYTLNLIADPSGEVPTVVLTDSPPSPEAVETLVNKYSIHPVLWETGSMIHDRPYLEILAGNIERLERAVDEALK